MKSVGVLFLWMSDHRASTCRSVGQVDAGWSTSGSGDIVDPRVWTAPRPCTASRCPPAMAVNAAAQSNAVRLAPRRQPTGCSDADGDHLHELVPCARLLAACRVPQEPANETAVLMLNPSSRI